MYSIIITCILQFIVNFLIFDIVHESYAAFKSGKLSYAVALQNGVKLFYIVSWRMNVMNLKRRESE